MAKHSQRDPEKEQFWRRVLEEHRRSGLNARAFCRREGVSEASFYGWRRELRQRDRETSNVNMTGTRPSSHARQSTAKRSTAKRSATQPAMSASLVEVVTREAAATPAIEIETPDGYTIRLRGAIDRDMLSTLVDLLALRATQSC
jgi:transposase-like protein